jgi:hypothetical protein
LNVLGFGYRVTDGDKVVQAGSRARKGARALRKKPSSAATDPDRLERDLTVRSGDAVEASAPTSRSSALLARALRSPVHDGA